MNKQVISSHIMHLKNEEILQGGKYKIVRFIASGGFGCTYEAHHTLLDLRVALKEFFVSDFCNRDENTGQVTVGTHSKVGLYDKLKKKFLDEARALYKMKHPGIVRVIDVFEENGTAYYTMEYIDGHSLSDVVKKAGKLQEAEAVGYILQVADALKYVHGLNRLHLDIKPGNIMLNKDGKVVLIDFGASKHYDDETGENTSTLLGINTKGYAPVEQVNQSFKSFSPATDIYALGATLYKLLTGITPPSSTLLQSEEATLIPLPSSLSSPTRKAVEAAMQLLRKKRPQSVDDWKNILVNDDLTVVDVVNSFFISNSKQNIITHSQQQIDNSEENHLHKKRLTRIILGIVVMLLVVLGVMMVLKANDRIFGVENGFIDLDSVVADNTETDSVTVDLHRMVVNPSFKHKLGICVYKGMVDENNLPDGEGVATWESGDVKEYDGQWAHGVMEGNATYILRNGDVFKGTFKKGKPNEGNWYNKGERILQHPKIDVSSPSQKEIDKELLFRKELLKKIEEAADSATKNAAPKFGLG